MNFLFYGDVHHPRKRESYQFKTIASSEHYKGLQNLPSLPSSSNLRQDQIFNKVSNELNQIVADISVVYSKLQDEVDSEGIQTEEINTKVNHSVRKLEASFAKLLKLRSKFIRQAEKKRTRFDDTYGEIDKKIRMIKDANEELLEYVSQRNIAGIDKDQFPRIMGLLKERFPDLNMEPEEEPEEPEDEPVEPEEREEEPDEEPDEEPEESKIGKTSVTASATLFQHSAPSLSSTPLTFSSICVASEPSIATTLESICITEPFSRPQNTVSTTSTSAPTSAGLGAAAHTQTSLP
ncbi:protein VAB2 [Kluyveromyces marxianus]|nr:protein VAB2 [Kluyveromyces marxianus]